VRLIVACQQCKRQYDASGVIVDICGSHGIWFDAQELACVLRWIRSGNLEAARDDLACLVRSPDLARKRKLRRRSQPEHRPSSPMPLGSESDDDDFPLEEIAEGAIRVIRTLFRMFWRDAGCGMRVAIAFDAIQMSYGLPGAETMLVSRIPRPASRDP